MKSKEKGLFFGREIILLWWREVIMSLLILSYFDVSFLFLNDRNKLVLECYLG